VPSKQMTMFLGIGVIPAKRLDHGTGAWQRKFFASSVLPEPM